MKWGWRDDLLWGSVFLGFMVSAFLLGKAFT